MKTCVGLQPAKGISLIELLVTMAIASITAAIIVPEYSAYRLRAQRLNAQSCLIELARKQEAYFVRHHHYVIDLRSLGYDAENAASCGSAHQYRLTATLVDATTCPLNRCYRLSAIPSGAQAADGALYLTHDASQTDANNRLKKERGNPGSGKPWN